MASSGSKGKRLPISCQACRTRKIRCSRDGRPCQTCVRRGLRAEDFIYIGQPRLSAEQPLDSVVQTELRARIRTLEELLRKQMNLQPVALTADTVSTLRGTSAGDFSGPETWDTLGPMLDNVGTLHMSPSGHMRYMPLASQWESLVVNGPTAECFLNSDLDIAEDDNYLKILLAGNGSGTRSEMLSILPPGLHCATLKDVYFQVLSSVCCMGKKIKKTLADNTVLSHSSRPNV